MDINKVRVINAAGKLTALGGSAQSSGVAGAQSEAARAHVDLASLRAEVAAEIADYCGAEAACLTSGAAAGICISIAALVCKEQVDLVTRLPVLPNPVSIVLQAGHNINFGADVTQMVHLTGANTVIAGSEAKVTPEDIQSTLKTGPLALLFVQSHHCIQENRVDLATCISLAEDAGIPVVVDAAAEDDLQKYIALGADLVTYSGGKAFGGPTSGFIVGRRDLIKSCERQFSGIARPMKVSKEQILGLATALQEYINRDQENILREWARLNQLLIEELQGSTIFRLTTKPDEAGRDFERVAISPANESYNARELVQYLAGGEPSIRTRNHQIAEQRILVDPRELDESDIRTIATRLVEFESQTT